MWVTDPKTGQKSVTLTLFIVGFMIATGKLLCSGVQLGNLVLSPFSGTDFAAVVGALGAIYAARKHTDSQSPDKDE